ncbi:MAG: phosphoenolpyruvate--protein phosphotransferase [Actinomycetota bacterium]
MTARLQGQPAAPGAALAPAFVVEGPEAPLEIPEQREVSPEDEMARLDDALERASSQLAALAGSLSGDLPEEAEIFQAHAAFAADPEIRDRAATHIGHGASAERAVTDAFDGFRELLAASESEYLAARAEDLDDVRDRVVRILQGIDPVALRPDVPSVIVADTLTPSQTVEIPRPTIAAIVTATGSATSHAAILARALGVPAVVAAAGLMDVVRPGLEVGVDGRSGEVAVEPDDDEKARFAARIEEEEEKRQRLAELRDIPAATSDGHRLELAANIGSPADLAGAIEAGAEGSGLVRTEFLFIDRSRAPSVEDQVDFYREVALAFPGHRVVFRTLDVGADKPLPFVDRDPEPNPALGVRGIRLGLDRPQLLRDQLQALIRARAALSGQGGDVAIMFPLVTVPAELASARRILATVAEEEGEDVSDLEVGAMIEVPLAALAADRIARHADFLSIGTNDLIQYVFAADRLVGDLADLADIYQPEMLGLLAGVVEAGHRHGAWVGVCGESAADPGLALLFTGLGVDELSMTSTAIPEVKAALRGATLEDCRRAAAEALAATSAEDARRTVRQMVQPG